MAVSSAEQLITHLASKSHKKNKTKLEKELRSIWNGLQSYETSATLLRKWTGEIK
jgi:hypothetical protein